MSENKLKHLELIQGVINRMSSNSFMIKGWTITLISAFFAFAVSAAEKEKIAFIVLALLPVLAFWLLDGYFLWQERLFKEIYKEVAKKKETDIDFEMNPQKHIGGRNTWAASMFSSTLNMFYLTLLGMIGLIFLSLKYWL